MAPAAQVVERTSGLALKSLRSEGVAGRVRANEGLVVCGPVAVGNLERLDNAVREPIVGQRREHVGVGDVEREPAARPRELRERVQQDRLAAEVGSRE